MTFKDLAKVEWVDFQLFVEVCSDCDGCDRWQAWWISCESREGICKEFSPILTLWKRTVVSCLDIASGP